MRRRRGLLVGAVLSLVLLSTPIAAERPRPPTAQEMGVAIYPGATYIASFEVGPAVRYLFATNAAAIDVVRFYERETGKEALLTSQPDGIDSYKIVAKGDPPPALPELEIWIERPRGAASIPDERGGVQQFGVTIFVSRRVPAGN